MATAVSKIIDELLNESGDFLDGSGFWKRSDVRLIVSNIQRQITKETGNLRKETATLEPAADATEITIESSGNLLEIIDGYRLETTEGPVNVYTLDQIVTYDRQWKTREGALILALISDPALISAGKARIYPIVNNANNDIIVWFKALAAVIDVEVTEAGDASNQLSSWIINGVTSSNSNSFVLYYKLTNSGSVRTVNVYKDSAGANEVASGSVTNDGEITLTASNDSGITGWVTVAYTIDDTTVSANTLTFKQIEILDVDIPCLKAGCKWELYRLEKDSKDFNKAEYYRGIYGYDIEGLGRHRGLLAAVIDRISSLTKGTFSVMKSRSRRTSIIDRAIIDDSQVF